MLGVGFLIYSALVGGVQGKAAPQAVFNKPIQLLGDVSDYGIMETTQIANLHR